jgi:predicted phosphodiesterase
MSRRGDAGDLALRYAIISDIHANLEALKAVLEKIEELSVDRIVCPGDVVGYNANPNERVDILRKMKIPTVCGNHDAVACGIEEPWGFNPVAFRAVQWTRETFRLDNHEFLRAMPDVQKFDSILAVHGSPSNRNSYLFTGTDVDPHLEAVEEQECSFCVYGHTHMPILFWREGIHEFDQGARFELIDGNTYFFNVGSVGQPRDGGRRAAFGVVDLGTREIELIRVACPDNQAAAKVINAAPPPPFGGDSPRDVGSPDPFWHEMR